MSGLKCCAWTCNAIRDTCNVMQYHNCWCFQTDLAHVMYFKTLKLLKIYFRLVLEIRFHHVVHNVRARRSLLQRSRSVRVQWLTLRGGRHKKKATTVDVFGCSGIRERFPFRPIVGTFNRKIYHTENS